jgi:hypothetical protein
MLTDGVLQRRPREGRRVLTALCVPTPAPRPLLPALHGREIVALRQLPQRPDTDGPDPTWERLTTQIRRDPDDRSTQPGCTRGIDHILISGHLRNKEVSGLRPALKDAARDTAWRRALPHAAIRTWFRCPGRASYVVKAAYPVVITPIICSAAKTVASSSSMAPSPRGRQWRR